MATDNFSPNYDMMPKRAAEKPPSEYVYETEHYGVKVLETLVAQVGTGFYGVVHKEHKVVEVSNPQLPVAIEACNHLNDKLIEARMSFLAKA